MQLRDGSQTSDPRLDRLVQFDEKSRGYPVVRTLTAEQQRAPRSYTWSVSTVLDQGREGSCVGHAWGHELIARPSVISGIDHPYAKEKIYWEAQKIDPWQGGGYPGASPQYEGTSVLAGAQVVQKYGFMDSYFWSFSLDELILGVGYRGPSVLGINWYEQMFRVDPNGYIHIGGQIAGGHAIICIGVSVRLRRFTLVNSWGANWGLGGKCYVSYDDMQRLLNEDGESCFATNRHRINP